MGVGAPFFRMAARTRFHSPSHVPVILGDGSDTSAMDLISRPGPVDGGVLSSVSTNGVVVMA